MHDSGGIRWSSARTMAKARCPLNWRYSMVFGSYDGEGSMSAHSTYCCACATLLRGSPNLLYFGCSRPMDIYRYQAEGVRTAVRLIRDDAASVSCMTDQICTIRASRQV